MSIDIVIILIEEKPRISTIKTTADKQTEV